MTGRPNPARRTPGDCRRLQSTDLQTLLSQPEPAHASQAVAGLTGTEHLLDTAPQALHLGVVFLQTGERLSPAPVPVVPCVASCSVFGNPPLEPRSGNGIEE
jgi:hypothetical protein